MAGVAHELVPSRRPPRSRSGKIPYIDRPDGSILSDSQHIIETVAAERGIDLDTGLSAYERSAGHLLRRSFEGSLYFRGLYERFMTPEGFAEVRVGYFRHMAWPVRAIAAVSAALAVKLFFLGDDPHTIDATAFAFLWAMSSVPFTSALRDALRGLANLVDYIARGRAPARCVATPCR